MCWGEGSGHATRSVETQTRGVPHAPTGTGKKELPVAASRCADHFLPQRCLVWRIYNLHLLISGQSQGFFLAVELSFCHGLLWSVPSPEKHQQTAGGAGGSLAHLFQTCSHSCVSVATALPDAALIPADQSDGKAPHRKWMRALALVPLSSLFSHIENQLAQISLQS